MFEVTAARMQKRATRKRTASSRWSKRISSWGRESNAIVNLFICNHDLTDDEGHVLDHWIISDTLAFSDGLGFVFVFVKCCSCPGVPSVHIEMRKANI